MKKYILVCFTSLCLYSAHAVALSEDQVTAVRALGKLNGIALHCGYFDQTRAMKKNLVEALPKRRDLGQAFDEATNESFLAFIGNNEVCPEAAALAEEIGDSLRDLRQKFSSQ